MIRASLGFRSVTAPLGSLALLALICGCGSRSQSPEALSLRGATPLVSSGAVWHYRDEGIDLGTDWRTSACLPEDLKQGPAPLGYGDGNEATQVGFGPDPKAKYTTTYFWHCFQATDPSSFVMLYLRLLRDDGAVVYLNGTELVRSNLPATGPIAFSTLALEPVGSPDESTFFAYDVPSTALAEGPNVVAVEIHQVDGTSSDIRLDLELYGRTEWSSPTPTPTAFPTPEPGVLRFAIIGDYGHEGQPAADVAVLVQSWNPQFIITVGDNNYPLGEASTIDRNIGQYYHQYIAPYQGTYGAGSPPELGNRFFPCLGNHDWYSPTGAQPFLDYFTLPGNERYYRFVQGPIEFFCVDSGDKPGYFEPDGVTATSVQGQWLQSALATSTAPWKLVYAHHPPYSSGTSHGSTGIFQWPFPQWGAHLVVAGHEHQYERLEVDGFPYLVQGLSGRRAISGFGSPLPGSLVRYNADYGALLAQATVDRLQFQFYTRQGERIDDFVMTPRIPSPTPEFSPTAVQSPSATPTAVQSPSVSPTAVQSPSATPTPALLTGASPSFGPLLILALLGFSALVLYRARQHPSVHR